MMPWRRRAAMLVGASLPPVYAQAASLAARIQPSWNHPRPAGGAPHQAATLAASLARAEPVTGSPDGAERTERQRHASQYGDLKTRLEEIAAKAANFQALLARIAQLRRAGPAGAADIVTVAAHNGEGFGPLTKGSLLPPVVGTGFPAPRGTARKAPKTPA